MGKLLNVANGRPRKPTAMKVLQGTNRPDRATVNEPKVTITNLFPEAPPYFDKEAKAVWVKTTRSLRDLNMMADVDFDLLQAYCFQCSIMERCAKQIAKESGLLMEFTNKGGNTNIVPNPLIKIYNDALSNANRLAQQFGFSPSARTRISAPAKKEGDGFEEF